MKNIKKFLKSIIPEILFKTYRNFLIQIFGIEHRFKGMSSVDIFDKIYKDSVWGEDKSGNPTSGYGSQRIEIVAPYVKVVKKMIKELHCSIIVDLGCGDFNVGKNFIKNCDKYIACDISDFILNQNRQRYSYNNLEYKKINLAEDDLPIGDLAFVRLVLQHLCNNDIKNFVDYINKHKPYKYLLVTEHMVSSDSYSPNLDKPSGSNIRLLIDSAVELDKKPFNLQFKTKRIMCNISEVIVGNIQSILYEF